MSQVRDYQAVWQSQIDQISVAAVPTRGWCDLHVLYSLCWDAWLLIASKFVRMFSYGFLAVVLVIFLQQNGFTEEQIGSLLTLTLLGNAVLSVFVLIHADHWGRRSTLVIGSVFAIFTSFIFATQNNYYVLLIAGIFGVISPSGGETGPFMAVEMSALSQVTSERNRTSILAWYNLFGSFATACGALICGTIEGILQSRGYSLLASCRYVMIVYGLVQSIQALFVTQLSSAIEVPLSFTLNKPKNVSYLGFRKKSRKMVIQLSFLFILDSLGGSFVLQSIISGWFFDIYQTPSTELGSILFYCNMIAGVSALFAIEIANHLGLVMTMVVTHLPSNILLILVPVMPNQMSAMIMLGARYSISQMHIPVRNAYVQSVVEIDERSAANGVANVVRNIGGSFGPFIASLLMARGYMSYPFYIAGGLKIVYDLLLLFNFAAAEDAIEAKQGDKVVIIDDSSSQDNRYLIETTTEEKIELIASRA